MSGNNPDKRAYTGANLEELVTKLNPEINLESFLTDDFGLDDYEALPIAAAVRSSRVANAESDAIGLSPVGVPENDGSVQRLLDAVLPSPDKIVVRSGLVEVFRKTMESPGPGVLNLSKDQIKQSGTNMAYIYELGEFVSRRVYDLLVKNFRLGETQMAPPPSGAEAESFYDQVLNDLKSRDPDDVIEEYRPSDEAKRHYFRQTRPLRFCAAGGWLLINRVDERVNTTQLQKSLRTYHYDEMTKGDGILPSENVGSLYPLAEHEFRLLASFVRGTDKATPIDQFKS